MDASAYIENLLRERSCALCGADRPARRSPVLTECEVCGAALEGGDFRLSVTRDRAIVVCSVACLESARTLTPGPPAPCPNCGGPWAAPQKVPRSCGVCGAALAVEGGYVGLWRGGRVHTFCGSVCLEAYLRRENPYCG